MCREPRLMLRKIMHLLITLCVASFFIADLSAQGTGDILGTITDMTGAALPGAEVQVRSTGTAQTFDILADEQGRYSVPALPIGDYEISAALPGFSRSVRTGLTLTVGAQLVVNLQLAVGQVTETVTVEGQASPVETQSTALGVLVESKQIRELPLNGRNYIQLIALNPGVTQITKGSSGAGTPFYGQGQKYSISGARPSGQNYLLDGTDMTSFWNNGPGSGVLGTSLGVEAIAEFQALTNTASAQFGGNSAVINASSRSGTNEFHGSLYEFFRHDSLEARDFFDAERPPYRQNQFGASLGGPIKSNKLFFFGNYEGLRSKKISTQSLIVPNVELIGVSGRSDPNPGAYRLPDGQVFQEHSNPATRQAIRDALALYPKPITPIGTGGTAESRGNETLEGTQNYFLGRIDYTVSDKSSMFFRYILDRADRDQLGALPYWPNVHNTRSHYFTMQERHILSPAVVNVARVSFNHPAERGVIPDHQLLKTAFRGSSTAMPPGAIRLDTFLDETTRLSPSAAASPAWDPRRRCRSTSSRTNSVLARRSSGLPGPRASRRALRPRAFAKIRLHDIVKAATGPSPA